MNRLRLLLPLGLGCVAAVGCGGLAVHETPGAAGAGGADVASASSATSGQGGESATTTGSGGSSPTACGGFGGEACPPQQFCDWSDDSCGAADGQGVCQPLPGGCTADCPGVCGCDGAFYCNACTAHSFGVDVSTSTSCFSTESSVAATYWSGGLNHLIVTKRDETANTCALVHLAWPTSSPSGFAIAMPAEWGVSYAMITDSAAGCDDPLGSWSGATLEASGATGIIDWTVPAGMFAPCELSQVEVTLTFPGGTPWAPTSVTLDAVNIGVANGCQ